MSTGKSRSRSRKKQELHVSCENVFNVFPRYLQTGWASLTEIFLNSNRVAKEKYTRPHVTPELLILLGQIRTYVVRNVFECAKPLHGTVLNAFGSTNITSDYDVVIIGLDAPSVINHMFFSFLQQYGNTLPQAFDSNLYCSSLFLSRTINKLPQIVHVPGTSTSVLSPKTMDDKMWTLIFAVMKMRKSESPDLTNFPLLTQLLAKSSRVSKKLEAQLVREAKKPSWSKYRTDTRRLVANQVLCHTSLKVLYKTLYTQQRTRQKSRKNMFELLGTSNFFSIEAYYTQAAFNTVVIEQQRTIKLPLKPVEYAASALENLADLDHHIRLQAGLSVSQTLLKYSKYVARIYYALSQLGFSQYTKKLTIIKRDILPFRGSNISQTRDIPFEVLGYRKGQQLRTYLHDALFPEVLGKVEQILTEIVPNGKSHLLST